jgi:Flp pilus assembly protein CpaB
MILRVFLFAIMACGLLGFGAVAWVSAYPPKTAAAAKEIPKTVTVLAVAHDVHAGALLKSEDITAKVIATADVPTGATPDAPDARRGLVGGMVRRTLAAGDVILPADVMRPGDHGFLAAVLRPGMRAVTVGVDAVSGTAGLIWPGDRVDVIMTQLVDETSLPLGRRISSQAVLSDIRVIAIDQELVQGATPGSATNETGCRWRCARPRSPTSAPRRRARRSGPRMCRTRWRPRRRSNRNPTFCASTRAHLTARIFISDDQVCEMPDTCGPARGGPGGGDAAASGAGRAAA